MRSWDRPLWRSPNLPPWSRTGSNRAGLPSTNRRISRWPMGASSHLHPDVLKMLRLGVVIPAHPLALTADRKVDERHQVALTRYYCAAGAGGIAVGVHTTQFAIRDPEIALYEPVLQLASA